MEFSGFMLVFLGTIYAIFPNVNSLWHKKGGSTKRLTKENIKTIRVGGFISIGMGIVLLIASYVIN